MHYRLTIDGNVYLNSSHTLALRGADGEAERPDRATADAKVTLAGANVSVKIIAIGNDEYMTNFLTGNWEPAPAGLNYNPAVLFDPDKGIQGVLDKVNDPRRVGTDDISGSTAVHVTGTVARAAVEPMTGNAFSSDPIDFAIWVDQSTKDILKIELHDTTTGGAPAASWTLQLSQQNQPVTITKPSL